MIENLPFWVEITTTPSKKVSLMSEWESKLKAIVSEVKNEDVGSITGVPSWMMVLLQRTLAETGKENIAELWPNIEVFFHGGISFKPYKDQYRKLIGRPVEVVLLNGTKIIAELRDADEGSVTLAYREMRAVEGKKRKQGFDVVQTYPLSEIKSTKEYLDFK